VRVRVRGLGDGLMGRGRGRGKGRGRGRDRVLGLGWQVAHGGPDSPSRRAHLRYVVGHGPFGGGLG
jgi:hypothetical protein